MLKQPSPFPNLSAAGRELSPQLAKYQSDPNAIVLAIALGGVPVAYEVANFLNAPLDLILIQRLLIGDEDGLHICATSVAGAMILDDEINLSARPSTPLEHFFAEAIGRLEAREKTCRRGRPPLALKGKNIILVDCGIRTASTMKVAIGALRKVEPKQIIGAVPIASREGHATIANLCEDLICLAQPEKFVNAGFWYRDFRRPGDDEVGELLR